jgi:formyltetrahydrofolate deformylase
MNGFFRVRATQFHATDSVVFPAKRQADMSDTGVLLLSCPERKGVVAAVASFIYQHNGNIVRADEHQDPDLKLYFMRVEWDLIDFHLDLSDFRRLFAPIAGEFGMEWRVTRSSYRPKVAVFVSKSGHCLAALLYRHQIGELRCEIPLVIGNHDTLRKLTEFYGIPFHEIRVDPNDKASAERAAIDLLSAREIELVVLARYMQILSSSFIGLYPNRMINVHHSFLPAFVGAKPYHRSYERGVKLVGATSHYVTDVLDEGPIIEQDTVRVTHRDALPDLIRKGGDAERAVLTRAVRWHIENRIMVHGNKTVVFV